MANLITLSRFLLLFVILWLACEEPTAWQLINVPLVVLLFIADGLDGFVARRSHTTTRFGAVFDIAADRIVEYALWVILAHIDLVPIWVPLLFIVRGSIVDTIRATGSEEGTSPFEMLRSPIARFLVASGWLRTSYAVIKAVTFAWLLMLRPLPETAPELWAQRGQELQAVGRLLVYSSVVLCLARGLPVVWEFVTQRRDEVMPELERDKRS